MDATEMIVLLIRDTLGRCGVRVAGWLARGAAPAAPVPGREGAA